MSFAPIPLEKKRRIPLVIVIGTAVGLMVVGGYYAYQYLFGAASSKRWRQYNSFLQDSAQFEDVTIQPGQRCGDAPFAFPTSGVVFGLWDQSYRIGHRHSGLDIFGGTEPGVTPVYAAYPGYLTRNSDWVSTIIIRIPDDPLQPGRQIWTYYTHMASQEGESYIVDGFPLGTHEIYVEAGTLLGYQGNYSGDPVNPTGMHLHFSVVKGDGSGSYLNELDIQNTYDPSPYFKIEFNNNNNPDDYPICEDEITYGDWNLAGGE